MNFEKPFLTVEQQIDLLASRGLTIKDRERAKSYLSNISYYRLSAYAKYFQKKESPNHEFHEGVDFDSILNLYLFDRELRILVFDLIEKLEIAFRTQLTYCYSVKHKGWWYEDPKYFINNFYYSKNLNKIDEEIERSSEYFITHYKKKYSSPQRPPAWMTFEVISMGSLSKTYKNLKMCEAKK
jgi:abortive infection bacteriophage resistance protein